MECTVPPALSEGSRVAVCRPAAVARSSTYPDHLVELGFERPARSSGWNRSRTTASARTPATSTTTRRAAPPNWSGRSASPISTA
ncbi:hypothetical protein [Halosegnis marinus]|uniref:hypothetical protein n=1 Tax=Halosegnis marinus TaxID=3034023 RepID=UPI00361303C5